MIWLVGVRPWVVMTTELDMHEGVQPTTSRLWIVVMVPLPTPHPATRLFYSAPPNSTHASVLVT